MSTRTTPWLAWSLAALSVTLFLAAVALHILTLPVRPSSSWGTGGISTPLWAILPFLPFPIVGALIVFRRPTNPIGWISLAVGIAWMMGMATGSYGLYGVRMTVPGLVPYPAAVGSLAEFLPPTALLLGAFLILLFPDGRLPSSRWRPVAWLCGAVIATNIVVTILAPGPLSELRNVRNPFGLEGSPWLANATELIGLLFPICLLASASSLIVRYLRSGEEVREQIKWLAFAASIVALGVSGAVIYGTLFPSDAGSSASGMLGNLLEDAITLSFGGVPVAIGFAVLKYRLYDIDVVINRALVYGALTASLVLVYFGGVTATQALLQTFTGQDDLPQLAVVASTLVIAALFDPVRRRIQSFIDRRLYRRKYDARKTLEAFSAKLRDEADLDSLNADLVTVVGQTLQPAHVSLWLRPDTPPNGELAD
ncbi:MAG: hypothetical protein AVDCRST_MAG58-3828 [uncultured Rubrobacteraceae bacterium]|uniref:Uncharacterized protein n=1 Tax=uncultured Rubrobacteraceae bacterium TaxID=349277 RepID=A0A6J4RHA8_9ACTN|nr:MAG: hypothetical protein AVDCRST_MAG58-3828 [uncultured Rubrobacteraceae bacterium]